MVYFVRSMNSNRFLPPERSVHGVEFLRTVKLHMSDELRRVADGEGGVRRADTVCRRHGGSLTEKRHSEFDDNRRRLNPLQDLDVRETIDRFNNNQNRNIYFIHKSTEVWHRGSHFSATYYKDKNQCRAKFIHWCVKLFNLFSRSTNSLCCMFRSLIKVLFNLKYYQLQLLKVKLRRIFGGVGLKLSFNLVFDLFRARIKEDNMSRISHLKCFGWKVKGPHTHEVVQASQAVKETWQLHRSCSAMNNSEVWLWSEPWRSTKPSIWRQRHCTDHRLQTVLTLKHLKVSQCDG